MPSPQAEHLATIPAGSGVRATARWPPSSWSAVKDAFTDRGHTVVREQFTAAMTTLVFFATLDLVLTGWRAVWRWGCATRRQMSADCAPPRTS